jgi:3-hydroxyisobutyrate dehydrogenase-like beta-hydroxyacid dehydrogenase
MGFPLGGRLAAAGFPLKVYDIDRRVKEQFIAEHKAMDLMLKDLDTAINLA